MNLLKLLGGDTLLKSVLPSVIESTLERHLSGLDRQDAIDALDQLQALLAKLSNFCDWVSDLLSRLSVAIKPID